MKMHMRHLKKNTLVSKDEMNKVKGGWVPVPSVLERPVYLANPVDPIDRLSIEPNPTPSPRARLGQGRIGIAPLPTP